MAVSIDVYRSRIGQFNNGRIGSRQKYKNEPKSTIKSRTSIFKLILAIASIIAISTIVPSANYAYQSKQSNYDVPSPTNPCLTISPCKTSSTLLKPLPLTRCKFQYPTKPPAPTNNNFQARYKFGNRGRKKNGITIMHWNKGSSFLMNKKDDIATIIEDYRPLVLGLSEANLRKEDNLSDVQIPDYNLHTCPTMDNPDHGVSRVVVYTHKSLIVKPRPDLMNPQISAVWLEVGLPGRHKFLICNAYREWGFPNQPDRISHSIAAQKERWSLFLDKWESTIIEDKEVIVLGDINICHKKWLKQDLSPSEMAHKLRPLTYELFDRIIPYGFCQLAQGCSHIRQGQENSGLDHLYSNKISKLSEVSLHSNSASDHKMIHVVRYARSMKKDIRYVKKRMFKNFNEDGFRADVKLISWWPTVYSCTDANIAAENLSHELNKALDRWAPVKKVQIRPKYRPWVSKETKVIMKQRNIAQELASQTADQDDWRKFKNLRNTVVTRLRKEKNEWEKQQLDHLGNNSTDLWRNVKSWLGWKNSGPPTQLFVEKIITKPREIANTMNKFFISKVKNLQNKLPPRKNDPLKYLKKAMQKRSCSFKFTPVSQEEVLEIVKKLKNSKSTGLDNIDTNTIKLVINEILPALTHVVNLSLITQEFPHIYKQSKIIPLLKKPKDDPLNPKFYRPVSLLPILSKILERAVFIQIDSYISENHLLHPCHHGGRAWHSTTTALIELYDQWLEAVDNGNIAGCMMLDLSAAYDLANHDLILGKLELYGFEQSTIKWMRSYLEGRTQCVYIDGELSDTLAVNVGVPQGSVLGGLLYVLLVGDLPEVVHGHDAEEDDQGVQCDYNLHCEDCGGLTAFVDDSTFQVAASNPEDLSEKLTSQYRKLSDYMGDTGLVINDDKTHLIVMGTRKDTNRRKEVKVETGTVTITPVATEKLLGLQIHESLKFSEHCRDNENSLFKRLIPKMNALKMMAKNASFKTRLMVANATIMSTLSYMLPVWGGTEEYIIQAAQVIQNRAARTVTKLCWFTPQRILLQQTNWLSIRQLIYYHTILQVWRTRSQGKPKYMVSKFNRGFNYQTRGVAAGTYVADGYLKIPETKKALAKKGMMVRGPTMWNAMPRSLRIFTGSIFSFKKELKKWIKINVEP